MYKQRQSMTKLDKLADVNLRIMNMKTNIAFAKTNELKDQYTTALQDLLSEKKQLESFISR